MKISLTAGLVILLAFHSLAADPKSSAPKPTPTPTPVPLTKESARKAISVFRQDPFSAQGRAAAELVRAVAEKSDDIILEINPKRAPFLENLKLMAEYRGILLAAYIVGNVDSQLLHHEKKDDPYAGEIEVMNVYKQMKKREPALNLPEVENLIDLEKRGELKSYLESP
jgi:hypothetical protein